MISKKALCLLASALIILAALPAPGASAAEKVVFVCDAGSPDGTGTYESPYNKFANAVTDVSFSGGVIVVCGVTTIDATNCVCYENNRPIHVTSVYNGTDYREKIYPGDKTGARLVFKNKVNAFSLGGDYSFDFIDFCIPGSDYINTIISSNYHNFRVGENCRTLYEDEEGKTWFDGNFGMNATRYYAPIYLFGNNTDMPGGNIITGDYTVSFASGDWQSIRIGERVPAKRSTLDCAVTLNISGGRYAAALDNISTNMPASHVCVIMAYTVSSGRDFSSTLNITGGEFYGSISAFGTVVGHGAYTQAGRVTLNIMGGSFLRNYQNKGSYILPVQYTAASYSDKTYGNFSVKYEDTASVTLNIAPELISLGKADELNVLSANGVCAFEINMTREDSRILTGGITVKTGVDFVPETTAVTDNSEPEDTDPVIPEASPTEYPEIISTKTLDALIIILAFAAVISCAVIIFLTASNKKRTG